MKIEDIPILTQRQDSIIDQLQDLIMVANRLGMYDASDAIRQIFETDQIKNLKYGCHCDLENTTDGKPDDCVIDYESFDDCIYAKKGMRKEQCEYWKLI